MNMHADGGKDREIKIRWMKAEWQKGPLKIYLGISLFCLVFSRIYNHYGHGVTSLWMTFLFAWPLLLGALPAALAPVLRGLRHPEKSVGSGDPDVSDICGKPANTGGYEKSEYSEKSGKTESLAGSGRPEAIDINGKPVKLSESGKPGSLENPLENAETHRIKEADTSILRDLYPFGIAALTVASLLNGILEIAGTGSDYPSFLLTVGGVMLFIGAWVRWKSL